MQPTTEILERISKDSLTHKEEVFTRLYRYLLRPDIYYQAYQRLYTNKGASTKGINQDTADGFSEAKIEKIIQSLADETYQPTPVRRTYIAKKSNPKKKRPLGIPTFTDTRTFSPHCATPDFRVCSGHRRCGTPGMRRTLSAGYRM